MVPLFVNVVPPTFRPIVLFELTVVPEVTVIFPVGLPTAAAPLMFNVPVVAPPIFSNVKSPTGLKLICPPALLMLAAGLPAPLSDTLVPVVELPMLMVVDALDVVIAEPLFRIKSAVSKIKLEPVETVSLTAGLMTILLPTKRVVPVAPGENCCEPVKVSTFAAAETVIVPDDPPVNDMTPVPPLSEKALALWRRIFPPLLVDVIVPAFEYPVLPATFKVISLFELSVVLAAIVVTPVPDVVVVTAPPLNATVPRPFSVKFLFRASVNVKLPPVVVNVPVLPAPGPVIVMSPVPPFMVNADAPLAVTAAPLPT
jgi:hypothetical protein